MPERPPLVPEEIQTDVTHPPALSWQEQNKSGTSACNENPPHSYRLEPLNDRFNCICGIGIASIMSVIFIVTQLSQIIQNKAFPATFWIQELGKIVLMSWGAITTVCVAIGTWRIRVVASISLLVGWFCWFFFLNIYEMFSMPGIIVLTTATTFYYWAWQFFRFRLAKAKRLMISDSRSFNPAIIPKQDSTSASTTHPTSSSTSMQEFDVLIPS